MKKTLVTSSALAFTLASNNIYARDIAKGNIEMAGGFSFSFSSQEITPNQGSGSDSDRINLDLSGLYYISENIGLGIILNKTKLDTSLANSSASLNRHSLGPQLSYNHSLNESTSAFATASYAWGDSKTSTSNTVSDTESSGWAIGAGVKYFLSDSVSLNSQATYADTTLEVPSQNIKNQYKWFGIKMQFSIYFQ